MLNGPGDAYRSADVRYFGRMANYSLGVDNYRGEVSVSGGVEGSIVAMEGLHFSRPIHSGFAVVHGAGANTPIFVDTVRITNADRNGAALVGSYSDRVIVTLRF